jgi:tetratricopeptide (TPR) repeat protein
MIFEQVCQTVAYAHAQGIIHRDLKPANIMVGAFGEVQVMDWGLAKILKVSDQGQQSRDEQDHVSSPLDFHSPSPGPAETEAGRILGTPAYMAPEQARGEVQALDERCDVFGLGAILCEMLTDKPPFAGDTQPDSHRRAARGDLAESFARLDGCGAEAELVHLTKQCLAADRDQRPRHAGVVAGAVAQHQTQVRERLRQAELERAAALARAEEEQRRRVAEEANAAAERKASQATKILAVVAGLFVLAVAGAAVWYYQDQAARAAEETNRAQEEGERKANEAQRATAEASHHEYLENQVSSALEETVQLRQKLQKQLGNPLTVCVLLSDLDQWQVKLDTMGAAWQRAKVLAAGADPPVRNDLAARLAAVDKQLQADQKDFEAAKKLDDVRMLAAVGGDSENVNGLRKKVSDTSATVFQDLGVDVQKGELKTVAAQISKSPLRFVLVAALDYWAEITPVDEKDVLKRVLTLAREVDPDRWRDHFRDEQVWFDSDALGKLAAEVDLAKQSPHILSTLAARLHWCRKTDEANTLLRKALLYHPKDFWLHFNLGYQLTDPVEQAGCYRAALAIRPDSSGAHNNLAIALQASKDYAGAIAHYEKATAADPKCAEAFNNWGTALKALKDLDGAAAKYQEALKLNPKLPPVYCNLGNILFRKKDPEGAIVLYRKALALFPEWSGGEMDEYYQKALASIHYGLGLALEATKKYDEAVAQHLKALAIKADLAEAHGGLGQALLKLGKFAEAEEANLHFVQLLPPGHALKGYAQKQLQLSKYLRAMDEKLAEVLQGKIRPPTAGHYLVLARLCREYKQYYATAARFYTEAFKAAPVLVNQPPHRYLAARAAALAGTGTGKDVDKLDDADKAKLRQQALEWLKDELAHRPQFQGGTVKSIVAVAQTMLLWQSEPDLAGVRDEPALAKLPKAEQEAWHHFWADVAKQLKEAQSRFTETILQGTLTIKKREQVHSLKLVAGKTYVFELGSKVFDTHLRLEDAQGKLLADDMHAGSNLNARIIYTATQDGTYRLVAASVQQETGAYTLTIWEFPGK